MRTPGSRSQEQLFDEDYFERKARELVVADDEIEAWELDSGEFARLGEFAEDDFSLSRLD